MKKFLVLLVLSSMQYAYACPMCAGSDLNPGDKYLVYILGSFILLTYIPFFFLYKMVIKNRHLNAKTMPGEASELK